MASPFLFVFTFVDDGIVQLMLCISYYIKNLVEFNGKRKKKTSLYNVIKINAWYIRMKLKKKYKTSSHMFLNY